VPPLDAPPLDAPPGELPPAPLLELPPLESPLAASRWELEPSDSDSPHAIGNASAIAVTPQVHLRPRTNIARTYSSAIFSRKGAVEWV
jgi:hypothetical protein